MENLSKVYYPVSKYLTWVKVSDNDKQSSLLRLGTNYARKKFYDKVLRISQPSLMFASTDRRIPKRERCSTRVGIMNYKRKKFYSPALPCGFHPNLTLKGENIFVNKTN